MNTTQLTPQIPAGRIFIWEKLFIATCVDRTEFESITEEAHTLLLLVDLKQRTQDTAIKKTADLAIAKIAAEFNATELILAIEKKVEEFPYTEHLVNDLTEQISK